MVARLLLLLDIDVDEGEPCLEPVGGRFPRKHRPTNLAARFLPAVLAGVLTSHSAIGSWWCSSRKSTALV